MEEADSRNWTANPSSACHACVDAVSNSHDIDDLPGTHDVAVKQPGPRVIRQECYGKPSIRWKYGYIPPDGSLIVQILSVRVYPLI